MEHGKKMVSTGTWIARDENKNSTRQGRDIFYNIQLLSSRAVIQKDVHSFCNVLCHDNE